MPAQVVTDAGKTVLQAGDNPIPGSFPRADAVHQVKRRTLALDTITDVYCCHNACLRRFRLRRRRGVKMRHDFFGETLDRFQYFRLFDTEVYIHDKSIDPGFGIG